MISIIHSLYETDQYSKISIPSDEHQYSSQEMATMKDKLAMIRKQMAAKNYLIADMENAIMKQKQVLKTFFFYWI